MTLETDVFLFFFFPFFLLERRIFPTVNSKVSSVHEVFLEGLRYLSGKSDRMILQFHCSDSPQSTNIRKCND